MANNEMQWSSATPGLLIILIDQSGSMTRKYVEDESRSEFATKAINRLILTLINKNANGTKPKNRCVVSVYGYDRHVHEIVYEQPLSYLYENPKYVKDVIKKTKDVDNTLKETLTKMPIWVEPIYEDGVTNMMDAFQAVEKEIRTFVDIHPDYPAPIVINISDGIPYDGRDVEVCMKETVAAAKRVMSMGTNDGRVQVFNVMLGDGPKVIFPKSRNDVSNKEAEFLFDISTEIPEAYRGAAEKQGLKFENGARGAIYNADAEHLVKLLDFGSSKAQNQRDK